VTAKGKSSRPRVSVIVPVYNRRRLLRGLLDALAAQTFRDFEVVVVDDGSDDGSAEEAEIDARDYAPVRVIRTKRAGAVAARAAGVAASRAEFLAFTDSDCVPAPEWLAAGVGALDAGADVVNGRTTPAGPVRLLDHSVASGQEGLYPTCNVFYRRAAYDAAGGFDETAPDRMGLRAGSRARFLGFGEDTLLAWRVRRSGVARYAPDALVEHEVVRTSVVEKLSRSWMAAAFPPLVREVPELRDTILLRHRVSLGGRSRAPVYALAAAVAARRRALALAAALWWAIGARRELASDSRARSLAGLPVVMTTDAVVAAALVTGSLRARTIVL
jgi:cellulose synthase/poly-beta-1,6-N-acetylglucosamine synthase-like glycosyltransferase